MRSQFVDVINGFELADQHGQGGAHQHVNSRIQASKCVSSLVRAPEIEPSFWRRFDADFRLAHISGVGIGLMLIVLEIPVTIYTLNHQLIYDLLGESRGSLGMRKQLTKDLAVRYDSAKIRTAFGLAEMVQITLIVTEDVAEGVGASLIADWVLKNLNTKEAQVTQLEIDKVAVKLGEDEIKKAVLERITKTNQ